MEHMDNNQAAWLELTEWFILFGHQACKTHIKSIAIFVQGDDRLDLACGTVTAEKTGRSR
jgi:hypothetical protein